MPRVIGRALPVEGDALNAEGDAEVLRDAKRMHFLWQPSTVQQEAIDKCIDTLLTQVQ